jgi:membrane protein required for colicin V production
MIEIDYTNLNYLDITIASLVVILSIKGFVNGFFRELFGFLGLISGVFIASRNSKLAGEYIYNNIYPLDNITLLNLLGFISLLIIVWSLVSIIGEIVSKLASRYSKKGLISRIFGSILGGGKYFFLFSVVIVSLLNIEFIKDNTAKYIDLNNSKLYPYLSEYGEKIINLKEVQSLDIKSQKESIMKEELLPIDKNNSNEIKGY